jgi:hypothetical protein
MTDCIIVKMVNFWFFSDNAYINKFINVFPFFDYIGHRFVVNQTTDSPDILFFSTDSTNGNIDYVKNHHAQVKILVCFDNHPSIDDFLEIADYSFTYLPTSATNFHFNRIHLHIKNNTNKYPTPTLDLISKKNKFCCSLTDSFSSNINSFDLFMTEHTNKSIDTMPKSMCKNKIIGKYLFVVIDEPKLTDRIMYLFYNNCIPIFYGDTDIIKYFNPKRYIITNSDDCRGVAELMQSLIETPNEYLDMLKEPYFEFSVEEFLNQTEEFTNKICEQILEDTTQNGN